MSLSTQAVDNIGFVAAFCTTIAFVPQLVRVLKLRSARDISLGTFLLFSIGVFLWLLYGIYSGSKPVIASNVSDAWFVDQHFVFKMRYERGSLKEEL